MRKLLSDYFVRQLASLVTHTVPPNDRQHTAATIAVFPKAEFGVFLLAYLLRIVAVFK